MISDVCVSDLFPFLFKEFYEKRPRTSMQAMKEQIFPLRKLNHIHEIKYHIKKEMFFFEYN